MPNHYVTYVQQSRITSWKDLALQTGRVWPWVYGFDNDELASRLSKGSKLWIIGALNIAIGNRNVRKLPPMLVARIVVDHVDDHGRADENRAFPKNNRFAAYARRRGSHFFPANDATAVLLDANFGPAGRTWCLRDKVPKRAPRETPMQRAALWRRHCAGRFQTARQLHPPEGSKLAIDLDQHATESLANAVFVSYRHVDHRDHWALPIDLMQALIENGLAPWIDRVALPSSRALSEVTKEAKTLRKLLNHGLRNSKALLAVVSDTYGGKSRAKNTSWTTEEWERAPRRFAWMCGGKKTPKPPVGSRARCRARSVTGAAQRCAEWFRRMRP
jgi:hypothetical protein